MYNYTEDSLKESANDMNGTAVTPASENIFKVDMTASRLYYRTAEYFHCMTARLLFARKREQTDIQVAVAFVFTHVKEPNADDYKKLARVIKYLRGTIHLPLLIRRNEIGTLSWSVDA